MQEQSRKFKLPEGGWGWMVCLGSSLITFSLRSLDPSFGLLFGDLLKALDVATTGASVIMSILETVLNFSGMLLGPLLKRFGYRKIALAGSALSCTGLILTSQANSLTYIIWTYSIVGGLGTGLAITAGFVSLNSYFKEKRTQLVGLSMAGTSLGTLCVPQVVHLLLNHYDFRGAVLIIGALALHAIVGACLLQPVSWHLIPVPVGEENLTLMSKGATKEKEGLWIPKETNGDMEISKVSMRSNAPEIRSIDLKKNQCKNYKTNEEPETPDKNGNGSVQEEQMEESLRQKLINVFDLNLLKDPVYLNIVVGLGLIYEAETNFKFLVPFFLSSIGMSRGEVAFCISMNAFADVVARLTMPTIFNKFKFRNRNVIWVSSILLQINRLVMMQLMPGKLLITSLMINGFFRGTAFTNFNLSVSEHCDLDVLPSAMGILNVTKGVFVLTLGPLVGYIRDTTGSYGASVYTMTIFAAISSIMWGTELVLKNIRMRRNKFEKRGSLPNGVP